MEDHCHSETISTGIIWNLFSHLVSKSLPNLYASNVSEFSGSAEQKTCTHYRKLEGIWLSWLGVSSGLAHLHLHFIHCAKYARMLLSHDAILIFQWDWSKVAAIYIFVNKLPCKISMGKSRCYFIWKIRPISSLSLFLLVCCLPCEIQEKEM